jgi:hypothetical protein
VDPGRWIAATTPTSRSTAAAASLRLYWGTPTQDLDPQLLVSGVSHPAYRRQCYVVFDLFLGANKTIAPNIEFVMRRYPSEPWLTTSAVIGGDANLAHAFVELSTNPVFGLPQGLLDAEQLNAVAARLAGDDVGASPAFLVRKGFHPKLGARPMRDTIERLIGDAITERLLLGGTASGQLVVDEDKEKLVIA